MTDIYYSFRGNIGKVSVDNVKLFTDSNPHVKILEATPEIIETFRFAEETRDALEKRIKEYPPLSDLADMLSKWIESDPARFPEDLKSWSKECMAIKKKYPKPVKKV